jgi:hypothetical protein
MLVLSIVLPVFIADVVLLAFFVPYSAPAWGPLLGATSFLVPGPFWLLGHPKLRVPRNAAWFALIGGLAAHPLLWLSLARGWETSPTIYLAGFVLALLLFCAGAVVAWHARLRGPARGHCAECNYDLTGNISGRCPECGTPIPGAPVETARPQVNDGTKR